jgi:hypothetical protein
MHNHIADIGALANDVGYGLMNAHALRLRESLLRLNKDCTGHRLLRGGIRIGGARLLEVPDTSLIMSVAAEAGELSAITTGNATVRDRFVGTSKLSTEAAGRLGTLGFVARASGIDIDARRDHPFVDLGEDFAVVVETGGDVMSRYAMRIREIQVSAALITSIVSRLDGYCGTDPLATAFGPGSGLGLVEGWRGLIAHRVEIDSSGHITRAGRRFPSPWPTRSSPTSRSPTRASISRTPATTCDGRRDRSADQAFLTTLDLSIIGPKPSTLQSMSWSPAPSTNRMPRTFVPTLIDVALPLILRSLTMMTSSPSASGLPTASLTTFASDPAPPAVASSGLPIVHSCAHSGQVSRPASS